MRLVGGARGLVTKVFSNEVLQKTSSLFSFCHTAMANSYNLQASCVLHIAGIIVLIVFSARWILACRARLRVLQEVRSSPNKWKAPLGRGSSILRPGEQAGMPSVSVVMPVKWGSIKAANPTDNWRSQIEKNYGSGFEAVFCVESEDDLAVSIIRDLQEEFKETTVVKLIVAGSATTCSQKIHNMLAGVDACDAATEYVLFVDANMHMHPGTVLSLAYELKKHDHVLASYGYPLDVPASGASIWSYIIFQFRHLALAEFASDRSDCIWGGAMMMRKAEIDNDACGLKSAWMHGGYSDDMLVSACAAGHGRTLASPLTALVPNQLEASATPAKAWDFLQRQLFVLTTYCSIRSRLKHSLLLFAYAIPNLVISVGFFSSVAVTAVYSWKHETRHTASFATAICYFIVVAFTAFTQKRHLLISAELVGVLSPAYELASAHVTFLDLLTSFLLHSTLAPFAASYALSRTSIEWGGIVYDIAYGRVVGINGVAVSK